MVRSSVFPTSTGTSPSTSTWSTAMSVSASLPSTVAGWMDPSWRTTWTESPSWMTWWLVTIRRSSMTTPLPPTKGTKSRPKSPSPTSTATMEGVTLSATAVATSAPAPDTLMVGRTTGAVGAAAGRWRSVEGAQGPGAGEGGHRGDGTGHQGGQPGQAGWGRGVVSKSAGSDPVRSWSSGSGRRGGRDRAGGVPPPTVCRGPGVPGPGSASGGPPYERGVVIPPCLVRACHRPGSGPGADHPG